MKKIKLPILLIIAITVVAIGMVAIYASVGDFRNGESAQTADVVDLVKWIDGRDVIPDWAEDLDNNGSINKADAGYVQNAYLGIDDEIPQPPKLLWWQDMCRWGNNSVPKQWGPAADVNNKWINEDAATTTTGFSDEGRGIAFRKKSEVEAFSWVRNVYNPATDTWDELPAGSYLPQIYSKEAFDTAGIKKQAWIEGQGETRIFVMAMTKSNGDYVIDPRLGSPDIGATWWSWNWVDGSYIPAPHSPADEATKEVAWAGVHAFYNDAVWQGKYTYTAYNAHLASLQSMGIAQTMILPTYPNGASALGTKGYGSYQPTMPHLANVYDACASKNINGEFWNPSAGESAEGDWGELSVSPGSRTKNYYGLIEKAGISTDWGIQTLHYGDFSLGKDISSPVWRSYNYNAIWDSLRNGADGFWVDNYLGWDCISNNPLNRAFGDWNVYAFQLKVDSGEPMWNTVKAAMGSSPNVLEYVRSKNPTQINNINHAAWTNASWLDDVVWSAFKAHMSDVAEQSQKDRYSDVKEIAGYLSVLDPVADADKYAALGKTGESYICKPPEEIAVQGNDYCYMHFAAVTGRGQLDIVSTETNDGWNVVTGSTYDAMIPRGRKSGIFALLPESTITHRASIWYYCDPTYWDNEILGYVAGYQALANNITINSGEEIAKMVGTNNTANIVNKDIGTLKPYFGNRQRASDVAVLFSGNSEMAMLAPGGFVNNTGENCDTAFGGWCYSLDDLGIPYRCIQEWQLYEAHGGAAAGKKLIDICKILIMPNTTSMSAATVNNVLRPFLEAGGNILFTGTLANIGKYSDKTELYKKFDGTSPLRQLYNDYTSSGKVQHSATDPAFTYYLNHGTATSTQMNTRRTAVNTFFIKAPNSGSVRKVTRTGFGNHAHASSPSVIAYTHYYEYKNDYFIDLVNFKVNTAITSVTKTTANASVVVDLPASFLRIQKVEAFNADTHTVIDITANCTYNDVTRKLTVTKIPSFTYYYSIIVDGAID